MSSLQIKPPTISLARPFKDNQYVNSAFKGIRPVVVALIGVPMIDMIKATRMRWWSWIIVVSSMVLVCFLKVSPIYILVCVIVVAAYISWHKNREEIRELRSEDSVSQKGQKDNNEGQEGKA